MSLEISREDGITTYYCPVPDCPDYYYDYKLLKNHLKTDHPPKQQQLNLDSINIFQVIKDAKK